MGKSMIGLAVVAALVLGGGTSARAAPLQKIVGKKLLIKNPPGNPTKNKIVFLSIDPSIAIPSSFVEDPRCNPDGAGLSAFLVLDLETGQGFNLPLNCADWSFNGTNLYKYKDPTGATCKIIEVRNGVLTKAVCQGSQIAYDLGATQNAVRLALATSAWEYSTAFSAARGCEVKKDGSDDKTYLAQNCTSAPAFFLSSPSGAFLDGAANF
jgi:hypothetical protein